MARRPDTRTPDVRLTRGGLTERQSQTLFLSVENSLSQAQISKILGISQPTVHQHLEYAKAKMSTFMRHGLPRRLLKKAP